MGKKHCNGCGQTKPLHKFHKNSHKTCGYRDKCKDCRNSRRREFRKLNNEKFLKYERQPVIRYKQISSAMKRQYGITIEQYNALVILQNGKCAICSQEEIHATKKKLSVDHDHKTGKVRGLLCHRCNVAIGLLKESPVLVSKTLEYLERSLK